MGDLRPHVTVNVRVRFRDAVAYLSSSANAHDNRACWAWFSAIVLVPSLRQRHISGWLSARLRDVTPRPSYRL